MRLLLRIKILLLYGALSLLMHPSFAQELPNIKLKSSRYTLLEQADKRLLKLVLKDLSEQHQVDFIYYDKYLEDKYVPVSKIKRHKGNLEKILKDLLTPLGLKFEKLDTNVYTIIKKKEKKGSSYNKDTEIQPLGSSSDIAPPTDPNTKLAELKTNNKTIPNKTISGKVTIEGGEGLPGVNVIVKGTAVGATTNTEGIYSVTIPEDKNVLIFSSVGFVTQEIEIGRRSVVDVAMREDVGSLQEVVIIGYGEQEKVNVTGAVSSIQNEDLMLVPTANTGGLLAGRAPGIITKASSGLPGSDNTTIQIRGFGSALVLVDGVQVPDGLQRIDPNDIESITVLKDASAAVYGARAGNGVILVTTKRGEKGKPKVRYNASLTFQEATSFLEHVNAAQFVELWREADLLDNGNMDITFNQEDLDNYRAGAPGYEGGDWVDALIKNGAPMHQHSLKVTGGSDNVRYFTSFGYTNQESYFRSRDFDYSRYNVRANLDIAATKNLSLKLDLSLRREDKSRPESGTSKIWVDHGTAQPIYPTELPDPSIGVPYSGFSQRNPIATSTRGIAGEWDKTEDMMRGRVELEYRIPGVDGLKVKGQFNIVTEREFTKTLETPYTVFQYVPATGEYINQGTNIPMSSVNDRNWAREQIYPLIAISYEKKFKNHSVKALALGETITREQRFTSVTDFDLLSTNIPEAFIGNRLLDENNGGSRSDIGRKSIVGRLNYGFKDKYLLEATFRADGNVLFAPGNRWGYFPSVSVGWVLSDENFWQGIANAVSFAKLRASYSQTGNDRAGGLQGFDYLTGYEVQGIYLYGDDLQQSIRTIGLANPNLTWEVMNTYNVGLEAGFLHGRLQLEADIFYRKREGILARSNSAFPSTFGAVLPLVNINSRDNRGFELLLNYRDKIGPVQFNISPNMTFTRSKWIHFEEEEFTDPDQRRIQQRSGQWTNRNFGYRSDGIFMTQDEIERYEVDQDGNSNLSLRPGDIKFKDLNGDGVIDFRDQEQIAFADGLPELVYGMTLGVKYKGFNLNVLLQGASRFSVRIAGAASNMFSNFSTPLAYHYNLRWQPDPLFPDVNVNPNAQLPAASFSSTSSNGRNSDFFRFDVTYLRIKNINLSYTIPKSILSKIGFNSAQVYVAAENLATFSNLGIYKNSFDPESTPSSNSTRMYPVNRNYTVGFRLGF